MTKMLPPMLHDSSHTSLHRQPAASHKYSNNWTPKAKGDKPDMRSTLRRAPMTARHGRSKVSTPHSKGSLDFIGRGANRGLEVRYEK